MKQMTLFCYQFGKTDGMLERSWPDGKVFYQRLNYNEVV